MINSVKLYVLVKRAGDFRVDCYILLQVIIFHCMLTIEKFRIIINNFLYKSRFHLSPDDKSKRQCTSPTSRSRNQEMSYRNVFVRLLKELFSRWRGFECFFRFARSGVVVMMVEIVWLFYFANLRNFIFPGF